MTYVVTFSDFVPEPRYDGVSWKNVKIEEAAGSSGPFTLIDTITTLPTDPDPTHPAARSFTTHNAVLQSGWYRITFADVNNADSLPTAPVSRAAMGESDFLPSVQQVATLILSRTKDKYGNEVGTFNANTRPTDTQVRNIILQAATDVADVIGDDIPDALWDDASNVIAERAACMIETSYYSEQINTNRSPYPQLLADYERDLAALSGQDDTAGPSGPARTVSYSFPDSTNWMGRAW